MTQLAARFHPEAVAEAAAAVEWYQIRSAAIARSFLSEIQTALSRIVASPKQFPVWESGTRRILLRRFPFSIVFRLQDDAVESVAVAHLRRRPGYWNTRLK